MSVGLYILLALLASPLLVKLLCWYVSWKLNKKYSIRVRISSLGFFRLKGIHILLPNGTSAEIESMSFKSYLFSNEHNNTLVRITVSGVRLQGDFIELEQSFRNDRRKEDDPDLNQTNRRPEETSKPLAVKLRVFAAWLRFVSVYVQNISLIQLGDSLKAECFLHTTIQELKFSLETSDNTTVALNSQATAVCIKLMKNGLEESCLAHVSLNVFIKAILNDSTWIQVNLSPLSLFTSDFKCFIGHFVIEKDSVKLSLAFKNAAIYSLVPLSSLPDTAQEGLDRLFYLANARYLSHSDLKERTVTISEEAYFQWSVTFHLAAIQFVNQIKAYVNKFKSPSSTETSMQSSGDSLLNIKLNGRITLGCLLSNNGQTLSFKGTTLSVIMPAKNRLNIKSDSILMYCDENMIMKCEKVNILMAPEVEGASIVNRKDFSGVNFELQKNRALLISIETIRVNFPYKYNFGDTFNERFITITKWLKIYHKKKNEPITSDPKKVSLDMAFKFKTVLMEVADDPFEVKLRDNYELLEDEYHESLKRGEVLNERIEQLQRTNFVSASKIEELHKALAKKNADIYIQRQKQLCNSSPARGSLFTVQFEGINLRVAADTSLTGYDKVVSIMRNDLDRESPFPDDLQFSTLWCRRVKGTIQNLSCRLRDFPKPMMDINGLNLRGLLIGAEEEATARAKRTCTIDMGPHKDSLKFERNMTTLKFYHDMDMEVDTIFYTHGACWEPVLQQLNISFESIIKPSVDPSPTLTWWDRMRFLFHGPLKVQSNQFSLFFHASLNPYNSTELIEIAFGKSFVEWLTGKIYVKGDLDLLVHTASKYDECRIVHLPNILVGIVLQWGCFSNQNDHHSVAPCAADKVPEYSSHQVHDSFRVFRSHHLSVRVSLETKRQSLDKVHDIPSVLMYSSALRWLESQKLIFSGMARLTRRGKLFANTKPRKLSFSRIFKNIRVTVCLNQLKVCYWSSFSKTWGCEVIGGHLSHSAEHSFSLVPFEDGLTRRSRPVWDTVYMNSEVCDVEIWLHSNKTPTSAEDVTDNDNCRQYFLSFSRMSYNRETKGPGLPPGTPQELEEDSEPTHRLVLHDLKGAWTKENRDVVFALFDLYMKAEQLKKNLSTDALKGFRVEGQTLYSGSSPIRGRQQLSTSPASTMNRGHAATMLQKLIAESENNPNVVYTEDIDTELTSDEVKLRGVAACQDNDVIHKNWLIELVNSQVMLRGCETSGYVIVSSAKTQIRQKIHRPVWKERTLYSKSTWVGSVECMQYYATVEPGTGSDSDIVWLTVDNIQEKDCRTISDLTDLVGSGQSVGGVVGSSEGSDVGPGSVPVQLQRIISRCGCQFFFASFAEDIDPDFINEVPPLPEDDDMLILEPWDKEVAVDSFTLTHYELDISTNSQQFTMILDLVNNLLLYVEPHRKEAFQKLQGMRFKLQLSSIEDQRVPILRLQDTLRSLVAQVKQLERESYIIHRTISEEQSLSSSAYEGLLHDLEQIEQEIDERKGQMSKTSDDLALMISCFKESQITADKRERQAAAEETGTSFMASVIKRIEICFKQAKWRLTDSDGQLGLADLALTNFLYTKIAKNDDCVEHTLELGSIRVQNLTPNTIYVTVLRPTDLKENIPLDRHRALRIFCIERPPVGGIPVKEHFEVNVIPLTIEMTYAFFKQMLKFFFPGRESEATGNPEGQGYLAKTRKRGNIKRDDSLTSGMSASSAASTTTSSSTTVTKSSTAKTSAAKSKGDDIEKMRERAQRNQTFVYIKIPEVPITVSYKGNKVKNIEDIKNFSLILPTIEYHNQTWTWLDLLLAIKNESKHRLLSQAVKQKLHIKSVFLSREPSSSDEVSKSEIDQPPQAEDEEHKARLLLGNLAVTSSAPPKKVLSFFSHRK